MRSYQLKSWQKWSLGLGLTLGVAASYYQFEKSPTQHIKESEKYSQKTEYQTIYRSIASEPTAENDLEAKIQRVQAAKEKVASIENEIKDLEKKIAEIKTEISTLEGEVKVLNEELPIKKEALAKLQKDIAELEAQRDELVAQNEQINSSIEPLKLAKEELEQILIQEKAKLEELFTQLQIDQSVQDAYTQQKLKVVDIEKKTQDAIQKYEDELKRQTDHNGKIQAIIVKIDELKVQVTQVEAEVKAKQEELTQKEQTLISKKEELKNSEDLLIAKNEELKKAQEELKKAEDDLTNRQRLADLQDQNNRQQRQIDTYRCSNPYQLAANSLNQFLDVAQIEISQFLLNMNIMMSALSLQNQYDALFYNINIGQLPNINELLGTPQTVINYNINGDGNNLSSDDNDSDDLHITRDELNELLKNSNTNNTNPLSINFGDPSVNFSKFSTVSDFSRTNYEFKNFQGYEEREKLHLEQIKNEQNTEKKKEANEGIDAALNDILS